MTVEPFNPSLPIGSRHAGKYASEVPPEYLLELRKQSWFQHSKKWVEIREYVEINLDVLRLEATKRAKRRLGISSRTRVRGGMS